MPWKERGNVKKSLALSCTFYFLSSCMASWISINIKNNNGPLCIRIVDSCFKPNVGNGSYVFLKLDLQKCSHLYVANNWSADRQIMFSNTMNHDKLGGVLRMR